MPTVPLGIGAYKRQYGGEPEIVLINRFVETNPTNLREHVALLSRPGSDELGYYAGGVGRGNYSKLGLFNGDLFTVAGENLYRTASDGTKVQVTGVINGTGHPEMTWMKGIGYQYLFIADGLLLQVYGGGSHATGTLTFTPGAITNQVVEIDGVYYSWDANVDNNAPDGTAAHPWLALLGGTDAESLTNLAKLIDFNGVRGVDFSTALGGPNPRFSAPTTDLTTTLLITATSEYAAGNSITTTIASGVGLAWGATTLTGGGTHALQGVPVPDGVGIKALANVSSSVLASVADSQKFFWINPGEIVIDALNFAEKESSPDNIVDMVSVGDQVIITGQDSTENWYATGDAAAPFLPIEGRVYARGTLAGTPTVVNDDVILVGNDGVVYEVGYSAGLAAVRRISDHGIEERIRTQLRREQGLS
jgi:hypothetical protein